MGKFEHSTVPRVGVWGLLLLALASCRTVTPPVTSDPSALPARYAAALPLHFDSQQTLVFEFRPHWWWPTIRMTALGYSTVDRPSREYAVVCLSPLGLKLFDLTRSNGASSARFNIPIPGDRETAGQAIDADISDLYFDPTPPAGATLTTRGEQAIFRSPDGPGRVDYIFSATTGHLLSKMRFVGRHKVNTIVFSDYRTVSGHSYPATIVLRNHRERYTLTLKVKQQDSP